MEKYLLWNPGFEQLGPTNPDYMWEIQFAKNLGIDLFEQADEIMTFVGPAYIIGTDPRKKVVLKHWRNHDVMNYAKEDLSYADLLILYTNDVITGPWQSYYDAVIDQWNCKNFICVTEGRLKMMDHPQDRVYENHEHHANKIVNFCQFEDWNTTQEKSKLFDALIGSIDDDKKPNRRFLFDQLTDSGLLDTSFVNCWGSTNYRTEELKKYDDPAAVNFRDSTIYGNYKNGRSMSCSIPIEVYKQSWYTLVAETIANNSNYVTEKTSKPLFEKRLFVVFGAQGMLHRLHELGYKTFDGIIDESYDAEPDDATRWGMAFQQVKKLARSDHTQIYNNIKPILEHNHRWIVDRQQERLQGLKTFLDQHLNKL